MMLGGNCNLSQVDLVTICIYRTWSEDSLGTALMVSAKPKALKSFSAVYHKPTTGKRAVSCNNLESDSDVDLLIELLASQSDAS